MYLNDLSSEDGKLHWARNRTYYGLVKLLSSRSLSRKIKRLLFTCLILPVIFYESKTWALRRKSDENKFSILERKILRKIFYPIKDDIAEKWRRKKNRAPRNV